MSARKQPKTQRRRYLRDAFRSLRAHLILRTLLPVGLLVLAFAVVGQIGYTQVTESLVKTRDRDLATIEAARVGDYVSEASQALRQVAESPNLLEDRVTPIYYLIRDEPVSQYFDYIQVLDSNGYVRAASDATTGDAGRTLMSPSAFAALKDNADSTVMTMAQTSDGRPALVFSARYIDATGAFAGVVEGAINMGSVKLGKPLSESSSAPQTTGEGEPERSGAFSYLVSGDGTIMWHPNENLVGSIVGVAPIRSNASTSGALLANIDNQQSIIGYAPLNLGRLLPRTTIDRPLVQWYVVTQERWADVVAPLNSLLFGLIALALMMFMLSLVLVARSAGTLTRPVGRLVAASRALSAGRLRHRLEISGPAEIEELSQTFNVMADQLQASYADLENKVAERTQELENANKELERRLLESQTVQKVAANIAGTVGLDEILNVIAASAADALQAEGTVVFLPCEDDPDSICAASVWNLPYMQLNSKLGLDSSLSGITYKTGKPQVSQDATDDPRIDLSQSGPGVVRSIMSVPLISHGQIIGVINAVNKKDGQFTEDDLRLLRLVGDQTAVAIERAKLYTDTQQQVKTLKTVNELALSVTLSRNVEQTLVGGIEHIANLLGASGAVVYLYNEKARTLNYTVSYNLAPLHEDLLHKTASAMHLDGRSGQTSAIWQAFQRQQAVTIEDMAGTAYLDPLLTLYEENTGIPLDGSDQVHLGSLIALPLSASDKKLGSMVLYFAEPRHFPDADLQMYGSFAKIVALAVYNTQLIATASKLATVEERARLARELHDSVTQSLFSLNLTLRAAKRVLLTDREEALRLIDNVHDLAQGSLAEMRALIFELRPQALENEGLALALQKHADAVRARSGLLVHLNVEGDRRLPIDHEEALYQISREALHNIVKHAHATEAWVELDLAHTDVCLTIRDNGRGFDPAVLRRGGGSHIGTSTMQERANTIGGELEIKSAPGEGSEVVVHVAIPTTLPVPVTTEIDAEPAISGEPTRV